MIEVLQAGRVERCQERNVDGYQCDHFAEHFGSHQRALSESECLRWPSQDDVEDAKHAAVVDAMTDEEAEASLLDEGAANATIAEQKAEIRELRAECHGRRFDPNLVAEVERLRAVAAEYYEDAEECHAALGDAVQTRRPTIAALRAERDTLRAENDRMRPVYEAALRYGEMMKQPCRDDMTQAEYEADDAVTRALCDAVDAARSTMPL